MKHLRLFPNKESYATEKDNLVLPNVSAVWDKYLGSGGVFYHQNSKPEEDNAVVVATYNAVDDGEYGMQCYNFRSNIKSIKVDGVDPFEGIVEDEVEHNNTYELNDSNITINWDEWFADCPDEVMFNGKVNSLTLKPKDDSIVLSPEAFASGEISFAYVSIDEENNTKYIDGGLIEDYQWNFDASNNSISLNDDAINGDWWSYYSYAMFLVKCTDDMDFPEIIDTISVVNYTTGGIPVQYSFENEGIHEVEIVFKDNSIGSGAFYGCSSLTSITIPNSVTSIGESAFENCSSLTSITIPNSLTSITIAAFAGCSNLTNITITDSVTSIGYAAFQGCSSLTSITIPNSVTSIEGYVFEGCSSLTSITIPDSVTWIGESAFENCSSLTSITIPDSVTSIGEWAFYSCTGELIINSKIIETDYTSKPVWLSGSEFTTLTIGDNVTKIGNNAFNGYSSLTSITIPDSVASIGEYAFNGCTGELIINSKIVETDYTDNNYPSQYGWLKGSSFSSLTIGDNVTKIGNEAFHYCSSLTSVNIGSGVTSIGEFAFFYCFNLTSVNIGSGVTSIGDAAFLRCSSLTSITIPDSVTSIGNEAFYECSRLASVYCKPTTPPVLGGTTVFDNNSSGRLICVPAESVNTYKNATNWSGYANLIISEDTPPSIIRYTTIDGKPITVSNMTVKSNTYLNGEGILEFYGTTIESYAFENCSSLTSINIPDSVTSIGYGAFSGCTGELIINNKIVETNYTSSNYPSKYGWLKGSEFTTLTIGDNVTTIGERAFWGCSNLTSVTIPDSVTSIGLYAFYNCDGFTSVTIPDSVTSIGGKAFYECSSLASVYCKPTTPPAGDSYMFDYNGKYRKIYVPIESVSVYKNTEKWSSYRAAIVGYDFENGVIIKPDNRPENNEIWYTNGSTTEATTPYQTNVFGANIVSNTYNVERECWVIKFDGEVTSIGNHAGEAFRNCTNLTSVNMPDCVSSISSYSFYGCRNLKNVIISDSITSIGKYTFSGCRSLESITIPDGVTTIEEGAFQRCSNLTNVTIPNSVTNIGKLVFDECISLKSIIIPNSVTSIGGEAFRNCDNLTSVTIGDSVTTIGERAFYLCISLQEFNGKFASEDNRCLIIDGRLNSFAPAGLTEYVIPDSVTTIGDNAFYGCSSLTSVTIPDSVTTIGDNAFQSCTSLTSITCNAPIAPDIKSSTFNKVSTGGTLYVPTGSDYSSWMSTDEYYLGKYNWTIHLINR